jgi:hypothetical protein
MAEAVANAIILRPDLREALERNADEKSRTLEDLVNEAVGEYVLRLQQKKIDREADAYERMHPSLRDRFLGEWVAIHDQQLVDHDSDQQALYRRVRKQFGRTAVLMRRVAETPVETIWIRTRSTGKQPS